MINSEILVVSLDFDGCADKPFSRDAIIKKILETCRILSSIQKIVIMVGSLRQTVILDLVNTFKHCSFPNYISTEVLYSDFLPKLQQAIKEKGLPQVIDIEFAPLLLNDIYNKLTTGATFKAIQHIFSLKPYEILEFHYDGQKILVTNQLGQKIDLSSQTASHHMSDASKLSLIYAQAHHVKLAYPHQEILFQFYDDRLDILSGLNQFYSSTPDALPSGLFLELLHFRSVPDFKPTLFKGFTEGVGPLNPHYHAHVLQIAEQSAWKSIQIDDPEFPRILSAVRTQSIETDFQQAYVRLEVPAIPKKATVLDTFGKEQFFYSKICPNLFEIAYRLERQNRLSDFNREYWETHAEYDSLLEIYSEDDFPGIKSQLTDYAEQKCQTIGLSKPESPNTLTVRGAKETALPTIPKKPIVINTEGQSAFNQQFSYHKDCPNLFELAYTLERLNRLSRFEREFWEAKAEYEAIFEIYNEYDFPGIESQLNDYAEKRCQAIGLSKPGPVLAPAVSEVKKTLRIDMPSTPKKTIVINTDGQEAFYQQFSYHKDCPRLFDIAFKLERLKRLSRLQGEERLTRLKSEYMEAHAEYESLLKIYNDSEYPGIKAQLIDCADQRCEKLGLSKLSARLLMPTPKKDSPECPELAACQQPHQHKELQRPVARRAAFFICGEDSESVPEAAKAQSIFMGIRN